VLAVGIAALVLYAHAVAAITPNASISVDLDGDRKPDTVLLRQGANSVVVLVRFGDRSKKEEQFRFTVDPGREDAVCKLPVRLRIEPLDYDLTAALGESLPGFVRSKSHNGFAIVDEACDSIHFFWNHRTKRLEWWRL